MKTSLKLLVTMLLLIIDSAWFFYRTEATAADLNRTLENPHVWKPKTRSVSVFKNGYGFFIREGKVQLRDGWGHATEVPPATLGTLAIYAVDAKQVVDTVAVGDGELLTFDPSQKDYATKVAQVLDAAVGMTVRLNHQDAGQVRETIGVLKAISGGYAVIEQESSVASAIPINQIISLQRIKLPLRFHVSQEDGQKVDEAIVNMAFLRSGIVWIPEYTLKLVDEQFAELTLRGTLVNEAEDLVDCDVNFVVGAPHFTHTDLLSPIAVGHAIRAIGSAITIPGLSQQISSQIMNRAMIANNFSNSSVASVQGTDLPTTDGRDAISQLLGNLPQMETVGNGDYSVYVKENLTLRRGERATVTLMTKKIRYGHKYHWDTHQDVQHLLSLENRTQLPWTTGPCLALSGNQPLSEDILKYTPVNSLGELVVTTAINIAKQSTEAEIDRKLKAHEPQPHQFLDLVTIAGQLTLRSYEKEPIEITIRKQVNGKPISASHQGTIQIDSDKLRLIERNGTVVWKLTLEPGKEQVLNYSYERYVLSL